MCSKIIATSFYNIHCYTYKLIGILLFQMIVLTGTIATNSKLYNPLDPLLGVEGMGVLS